MNGHICKYAKKVLIDISHVSKRGSSLRITLPKKVAEKLNIEQGMIIGFYESDGKITMDVLE